jgi:hypothetical protein
MSETFGEADWKRFRRLQPVALDRFCERVLGEVARLAGDSGRRAHDRYLAVYRLLQDRDKALAAAFDAPRRSTALVQLARLRGDGLLTDEEFAGFSPAARAGVDGLVALRRR